MLRSLGLVLSLALTVGVATPAGAAKLGVPVPDGPWQTVAGTAGQTDYHAVARLADGGFLIVWNHLSVGRGFTVSARRFDATGLPAGEPWRLTPFYSHISYVAVTGLADGGYVIGWHERRGCPSSANLVWDYRIRRYSASNAVVSTRYLMPMPSCAYEYGQTDLSLLGRPAGGYLAAWIQQRPDNVKAMVRAFSNDNSVGATFSVVGYSQGFLNRLRLAETGQGAYAVAWDHSAPGQSGSYQRAVVRPYSANHAPLAPGFRVCGSSAHAACNAGGLAGFGEGGYALSWTSGQNLNAPGTYLRTFAADGAPTTNSARIGPISGHIESSTLVALPDGGVVALTGQFIGGIVVRRIDSTGMATGPTSELDRFGNSANFVAARIGTDKVVVVNAESDLGELRFRILRTTGAPYAVDDTAGTPSDQALTIDALANDIDPDQTDTLVITEASAEHGRVRSTATQKLRYTPVHGAGCVSQDTITYTIADSAGLTSTARVAVTISCQ
jgi:hypothetical protein